MAAHHIARAAGRLGILGAVAVVMPAASAAQGIVFRSGVDMVPLTVTVADSSGQLITGLNRTDFTVLEDGVPQPLSFFSAGAVPVDVLLVLDTSSSMASDMPLVRAAAKGLILALRPGDRAAVLAVQASVAMPQGFSGEFGDLAAAIDRLPAAGTTALYDGVYIALKALVRERRAQTEVRRQVLVVLSDGQDNASHVSAEDVADTARRVGASIYVVAMADPRFPVTPTSPSRIRERAAFDMRALATDTGGRVFRPTKTRELPGVHAIARELVSQYDLGYVPVQPARAGSFRRVAVRVLAPAAVVRTRSGYYADRGSLLVRADNGGTRE